MKRGYGSITTVFSISRACSLCKKDHKACNGGRPCARCIAGGYPDQCQDVQLKKRGRPRTKNLNGGGPADGLACMVSSFPTPSPPSPGSMSHSAPSSPPFLPASALSPPSPQTEEDQQEALRLQQLSQQFRRLHFKLQQNRPGSPDSSAGPSSPNGAMMGGDQQPHDGAAGNSENSGMAMDGGDSSEEAKRRKRSHQGEQRPNSPQQYQQQPVFSTFPVVEKQPKHHHAHHNSEGSSSSKSKSAKMKKFASSEVQCAEPSAATSSLQQYRVAADGKKAMRDEDMAAGGGMPPLASGMPSGYPAGMMAGGPGVLGNSGYNPYNSAMMPQQYNSHHQQHQQHSGMLDSEPIVDSDGGHGKKKGGSKKKKELISSLLGEVKTLSMRTSQMLEEQNSLKLQISSLQQEKQLLQQQMMHQQNPQTMQQQLLQLQHLQQLQQLQLQQMQQLQHAAAQQQRSPYSMSMDGGMPPADGMMVGGMPTTPPLGSMPPLGGSTTTPPITPPTPFVTMGPLAPGVRSPVVGGSPTYSSLPTVLPSATAPAPATASPLGSPHMQSMPLGVSQQPSPQSPHGLPPQYAQYPQYPQQPPTSHPQHQQPPQQPAQHPQHPQYPTHPHAQQGFSMGSGQLSQPQQQPIDDDYAQDGMQGGPGTPESQRRPRRPAPPPPSPTPSHRQHPTAMSAGEQQPPQYMRQDPPAERMGVDERGREGSAPQQPPQPQHLPQQQQQQHSSSPQQQRHRSRQSAEPAPQTGFLPSFRESFGHMTGLPQQPQPSPQQPQPARVVPGGVGGGAPASASPVRKPRLGRERPGLMPIKTPGSPLQQPLASSVPPPTPMEVACSPSPTQLHDPFLKNISPMSAFLSTTESGSWDDELSYLLKSGSPGNNPILPQ